jgi:predicted secreted Zn-dependent protease
MPAITVVTVIQVTIVIVPAGRIRAEETQAMEIMVTAAIQGTMGMPLTMAVMAIKPITRVPGHTATAARHLKISKAWKETAGATLIVTIRAIQNREASMAM